MGNPLIIQTADGPGIVLRDNFAKVYRPTHYAEQFLQILARQPLQELRVLDVGCGSGILGIFCARRGAKVTCSDLNPDAVAAAIDNAELNGVALRGLVSDGLRELLEHEKFDLIICNPPSSPGHVNSSITPRDNGPNGRALLDNVLSMGPQILSKEGKLLTCSNSEQDWTSTKSMLDLHWSGYSIVVDLDEDFSGLAQFSETQLRKWVQSGVCWEVDTRIHHNVRYFFAYY